MAEPAAAPRPAWGVAALLQALADALTARFAACTVKGEIAGFSRAASGHCYFNLKDAGGQPALIRCAMFRRAASLLDFSPADGQLVELRGRVAVYEPRGELQFVVEAMRRGGAGALFEQFLRLKAKLEAEGLFDAARKRALPPYPRRIGIVTSLAAAALHDVASVFARRSPQVEVLVYPSPVRGAEAPPVLAGAIALAGRRAEVDLLIVCRGGGSLEDLWAFNDERVVRAIAACPLPVVCGVGHETDVTLADFAADLRAPTPTAAAELAAPARDELLGELAARAALLRRALQQQVQRAEQRLDRAGLQLSRPSLRLANERTRLALHERRLRRSLEVAIDRRGERLRRAASDLRHASQWGQSQHVQRLAALEARLRGLDPQQVVARGYALIEDSDRALIVDPAQLHTGMALRLTLARGVAEVGLDKVERQ